MYVHSCVFLCVSVCFFVVCVCARACVFMNMHALLMNIMTIISAHACLMLVWREKQKQQDVIISWVACTMTHTQRRAHTHTHTYIDTLMRTHHSFAAHGSEEIRENAERRKRQGGEKPR